MVIIAQIKAHMMMAMMIINVIQINRSKILTKYRAILKLIIIKAALI